MSYRKLKWMVILAVLFVIGLTSSFVGDLTYKLIMMAVAFVGLIYSGWKFLEVMLDEIIGGVHD
mgnify:CR=1 FL=1